MTPASSSPNTVIQGSAAHHQVDLPSPKAATETIPTSIPTTRTPPTTTALQPSPPLSGGASPRSLHAATDPGSPKTKKNQSPLRQSVRYDADDPVELTPPPGFRGVIDFANSQIGRNTMSFTGDGRSRGRKSDTAVLHEPPPPQQPPVPAASSGASTPKNAATPVPAVSTGNTTSSSRFAVFASTMFKGMTTSPTSASTPVSVPQDDELMNLDIDAALYPRDCDKDTFSPAAYKNLQQTASGLLGRFQAAYQQRTIAYHELKAERGAQADEKEEAETKMHHLRMQLEDMARKAAEQQAAMRALAEDLARERRLRMEERQHLGQCDKAASSLSEGSSVSEDLGVEEDQRRREWERRRRSGGAERSSDGGFDTDEESVEEASLFSSRSRSPTIATTLTEPGQVETSTLQVRTSTTALRTPRLSLSTPPPPPPPSSLQQPQRQPQMNTLQKLFKGMASESPKAETATCRNCEGQDSSVAWDTVNLLKDENKGLKVRVGELETAVEGALDAVIGIGLREPPLLHTA